MSRRGGAFGAAAALTGLALAGALLLYDFDEETFGVGDVRHLDAPAGAAPAAWLDNRTILVSGHSGLWLVRTDRDRSARIARAASPPGWVEVSPNRRWVAYAENGESRRHGKLSVAAINGPAERVLVSGSEIYDLRWTRDARAIAFQREAPLSRGRVWVVSRDGGRPRLLRDSGYERADLVRFPIRRLTAPVNTRIGSWRVWSPPQLIREVRTTEERCAAPIVSPDGVRLACVHQRQTLSDRIDEQVSEVGLAIIRIS